MGIYRFIQKFGMQRKKNRRKSDGRWRSGRRQLSNFRSQVIKFAFSRVRKSMRE